VLVGQLKPKQTPEAASAEMMVEGLAMNVVTALGYSKTLGAVDVTESLVALVEQTRAVQGGNLAGLEATLTAQVVTLNAMFTQLAYQTSKMTIVDQIDRFTRLALKAQGQCRATVETLALMKSPTTVFARQANIAHGPQQVNNGPPPASRDTPPLARAGEVEPRPIELLEAHGERLELGEAGAAGTGNPALAAVGTRYGPAHR
jgi:hypothetical protein